MATKKTSTKSLKEGFVSKAEYDKFFGYIGKARVMAYQMSKNAKKNNEVRRTMRSIEKKLWGIGNDYYWGRMTDYQRGC